MFLRGCFGPATQAVQRVQKQANGTSDFLQKNQLQHSSECPKLTNFKTPMLLHGGKICLYAAAVEDESRGLEEAPGCRIRARHVASPAGLLEWDVRKRT